MKGSHDIMPTETVINCEIQLDEGHWIPGHFMERYYDSHFEEHLNVVVVRSSRLLAVGSDADLSHEWQVEYVSDEDLRR